MKLISFNVNGVRASAGRTLLQDLTTIDADIVCLQETKATEEQVAIALADLDQYQIIAHSAQKKGYSGTAILTKNKPLSWSYGIGIHEHDQEGRVITCEWESFYLVNVYVPNSSSQLKRLTYRQKWDLDFYHYLSSLEQSKPVIICGDFNVCHRDIDLARPKANYNKNPGYTQAEINGINRYIDHGFIDTFRTLNPQEVCYSWWSYRARARARNVGWRIDYFLCSASLKDSLQRADIYTDVMGSDHCPVALELDLSHL
jgi:exodeoxyribonuclease III